MPSLQELDIQAIQSFLGCATPSLWVEKALSRIDALLIDHAVCELKAAQQAISLINRYPEQTALCEMLSPLAREELLHFEKVLEILKQRQIAFKPTACSNYAKELHQAKSQQEPLRLIDTLIIASIIEARSCERFYALIPHLDESLAKFYFSLVRAEARHFEGYRDYAYTLDKKEVVQSRENELLKLEKDLILRQDKVFCFHSGV